VAITLGALARGMETAKQLYCCFLCRDAKSICP